MTRSLLMTILGLELKSSVCPVKELAMFTQLSQEIILFGRAGTVLGEVG